MIPISVLTIVHNRQEALRQLIQGLLRSEQLPAELIIVSMNESPYPLPPTPFPVRQGQLTHPGGLPLAKARNLAVDLATHQQLVFLDADCIPHPQLVAHYARALDQADQLYSGQVRYLQQGALEEANFWSRLPELSRPDPIRTDSRSLPYHLFWSLNFGCTRQTFARIGGFDEAYGGYGAEDTDFGFAARKAAVPLRPLPALAYHQYHPSYSPPLNHLPDIIANATYFKHKWQEWPMRGWLEAFQQLGCVHWTKDELTLLRDPTAAELRAAFRP